LIHVSTKMSTWTGLTKLKRLRDSWILRFFELFHLIDKCLLKGSEVRHRSCSNWLERKQLFGLLTLLSWLKVILLSSFQLVHMSLHSGRQFRSSIACLCISSNSLLSLMLVSLHHHFESRNEDSPRNVTSSELCQHGLVNIIVSHSSLSSFLRVTLMETKRLWLSFVLSQRCLSVPLSSFSFPSQEILIEWLSSCFWDFGWFYLLG